MLRMLRMLVSICFLDDHEMLPPGHQAQCHAQLTTDAQVNLAGYSCSKFYGILELEGSVWIGQGRVISCFSYVLICFFHMFQWFNQSSARTLCNPKQFECKSWNSSSFVVHESLEVVELSCQPFTRILSSHVFFKCIYLIVGPTLQQKLISAIALASAIVQVTNMFQHDLMICWHIWHN